MPKKGPYDKRQAAKRTEARLVHLKAWRKFRKLTVAELAEAADMSVGNVSEMENLRQGYSPEGLVKLAKALRTSTGALLMVDPLQPSTESIWFAWERATADQKQKLAEIAQTIIKTR